MKTSDWGTCDEGTVERLEIENASGMKLRAMTLGATLTELWAPDRDGRLADVVLGLDSVQDYLTHRMYFGATAGRVANRIRDARFELNGESYSLDANDPPHHLHGGVDGWDRKLWQARTTRDESGQSVEFRRTFEDGEAGYPGRVEAMVVYTLGEDNSFRVVMSATVERTTLINLAHHTYWNLAGDSSSDVLNHRVRLASDEFTPGDPVPVGTCRSVSDTPFDFREGKTVGESLAQTVDWVPKGAPLGFDHNWVVRGEPSVLRPVAVVEEPHSGRRLSLEANAPGLQFYSGNFLDGSVRGKGRTLGKHAGLCLETQAYPNAINVPGWRGQILLEPGQTYRHEMVHRFSVMD